MTNGVSAVWSGVAHHITQRGNNCQTAFFTAADLLASAEEFTAVQMLWQYTTPGAPPEKKRFSPP